MAEIDFTRILDKLIPEQDGPPNLTLRALTVVSVNGNGTVNLIDAGGGLQSNVGSISPSRLTAGMKVQVLTGRGVMLILGPTGTPASSAWVPTLTATTTPPTLGTGSSLTGNLWRGSDGIVTATARIIFGASGVNAGSGDYRFSIPVAPSSSLATSGSLGAGHPIGTATLRNAATPGNSTGGIVQLVSSTTAMVLAPAGGAVGSANPWAWTANSQINVMMSYPTQA